MLFFLRLLYNLNGDLSVYNLFSASFLGILWNLQIYPNVSSFIAKSKSSCSCSLSNLSTLFMSLKALISIETFYFISPCLMNTDLSDEFLRLLINWAEYDWPPNKDWLLKPEAPDDYVNWVYRYPPPDYDFKLIWAGVSCWTITYCILFILMNYMFDQ